MKFTFATALVAVLIAPLAAPAQPYGPPHGGRVFALYAQNGSGEHGTFALKPRGARTTIEVHLLGAPGSLQPAHLHAGTCANLNPTPKYPLKPLRDGISETSIDVPMRVLLSEGLALNVHQSPTNIARYVACGNL